MSSLPNIADESGDNYKFGFVTDIFIGGGTDHLSAYACAW